MTEEKTKTTQSMEELMIKMDGQIKALTGIAIHLLGLSAPDAAVPNGDANFQRTAKKLDEATWEKTKKLIKGEPSGVVAAATKLHGRIFETVCAQPQKEPFLHRLEGASKRELPEISEIQLTDEDMIIDEDEAMLTEPLVADTAALEEQILSLIRERRSKTKKDQQLYVETMALTFSLAAIASEYELLKKDVEFLKKALRGEINSLRTRQPEEPHRSLERRLFRSASKLVLERQEYFAASED